MTAQTTIPAVPALDGVRLRASGVVHSEILKLATVRSTWWTVGVSIAMALGLAFLLGATLDSQSMMPGQETATLLSGATLHIQLVGLVIAVLGALSIGGEYSTGMIRSTYTAVPRRLPSLLARIAVVSVTAFLVGIVTTTSSFAILSAMAASNGIDVSLADEGVLGALLGGAFYLAVVGAFSVGLGALLRSTAAAIGIAVGILFVLPIVVSIASALLQAQWVVDASRFLLSDLGQSLSSLPTDTGLGLPAVVAASIAWVLAAVVPALVLTAARDV